MVTNQSLPPRRSAGWVNITVGLIVWKDTEKLLPCIERISPTAGWSCSNGRLCVPITAQREVSLGSAPASCWLMRRAASSRCGSVCGLCPAGAFQRRKVDLLLALVAFAAAARARRRRLPPPRRAQQAVRSGRCAAESSDRARSHLACPLLPVRRTRGRGGEARAAPSSRSPAASWAMPGAGSPPLTTRSVPFDQGAVWRNRLFAPLCDSLCGC